MTGPGEFFWNVIHNYINLLIATNGWGGWSINPEGVKFLSFEHGIDDRLFFARAVQLIAQEIFTGETGGHAE